MTGFAKKYLHAHFYPTRYCGNRTGESVLRPTAPSIKRFHPQGRDGRDVQMVKAIYYPKFNAFRG